MRSSLARCATRARGRKFVRGPGINFTNSSHLVSSRLQLQLARPTRGASLAALRKKFTIITATRLTVVETNVQYIFHRLKYY
ncbi:hypothetical protein PUN28_005285 [Cardiocondyla obscurior]|uniref:Uncharacterized protein n=1 Tax=Cardiocondyla obscurior TaxID=286306 RepID=A0AAW2GGY4_9HYME